MRRFLRFAVEETLEGRQDQLKEYTIAVEVFDRDESYDSRESTIVRSEARRLRARLDEYYHGDGASDRVRIEVPKGGYAARFQVQEAASVRPLPSLRSPSLPVSALTRHAAHFP